MILSLRDAVAETSGGKAGALGALLRAGLPTPNGFVVPFETFHAVVRHQRSPAIGRDGAQEAIEAWHLPTGLLDALERGLKELGDPPVAVRSSADNEDTTNASAAGLYESVLGAHGVTDVVAAVRNCWASLHSPRALTYRHTRGPGRPCEEPAMAVLIQRLVDADVSGVMFTPGDPAGTTEIEASWGLGASVVGGTVDPDTYRITQNGSVTRNVSHKRTRLDRHGTRLVTQGVPTTDRDRPVLDAATATRLAELGHEAAALLGGAQDIEWAIASGRIWLLQARPVTAAPPPFPAATPAATHPTQPGPTAMLSGTPGSRGTATGTARVVRGADDFARVHPGDILVCPYTEPAWTPLLRIAAGVVTETGGALSHAAIVARERHIPAVLGILNATARIHDAATITIDGTAGTVTLRRDGARF